MGYIYVGGGGLLFFGEDCPLLPLYLKFDEKDILYRGEKIQTTKYSKYSDRKKTREPIQYKIKGKGQNSLQNVGERTRLSTK